MATRTEFGYAADYAEDRKRRGLRLDRRHVRINLRAAVIYIWADGWRRWGITVDASKGREDR